MPESIETLSGRDKNQVQNLDGSQELGVLYNEPKVE